MQKAGGIIALIAGIFGVLAAFVTLAAGGIGAAVEASRADTVMLLGWGGVVFSFLVIILGAITMNARRKLPAILLLLASLIGVFAGGTLVALFMVLSFIGGVLALFQKRPVVQQL